MASIPQPKARAHTRKVKTFAVRPAAPGPNGEELPPLEQGDRLDQKTFHARYEAMPEHTRAELIGGVVYLPSPNRIQHGRMTPKIYHWLGEYQDATPGTESVGHATTILGPYSETEPDASYFILPEHGGVIRENEDGYLEGAPELIAEVASSTESYDLHAKKRDYEAAGVREYVVVALRQKRVFWFVLHRRKYRELKPGADGVYRSAVFPGLWLDPEALLQLDAPRLLEVLRQGLATPEHAAFVEKLRRQQS